MHLDGILQVCQTDAYLLLERRLEEPFVKMLTGRDDPSSL